MLKAGRGGGGGFKPEYRLYFQKRWDFTRSLLVITNRIYNTNIEGRASDCHNLRGLQPGEACNYYIWIGNFWYFRVFRYQTVVFSIHKSFVWLVNFLTKKTKVHVYMFDYLSICSLPCLFCFSPTLYRPYYMNFCSCSGIIYFCRTNYQRKPTQPVFNSFFLLYSSVLTRMLDLANSDFYTLRFAP